MTLDEVIAHLEALRDEIGHGEEYVEDEHGRTFSKDDITIEVTDTGHTVIQFANP